MQNWVLKRFEIYLSFISQCILLKVVRLAISPVKPVQGSVRVRPHPVTVHMVGMMVLRVGLKTHFLVNLCYLCDSSQPELVTPGNLFIRSVEIQQHGLDPVVKGNAVNFN